MNPISDSAPTADEALQRLKAGNILLPRLLSRCRRRQNASNPAMEEAKTEALKHFTVDGLREKLREFFREEVARNREP
jgi:hypothetical protein